MAQNSSFVRAPPPPPPPMQIHCMSKKVTPARGEPQGHQQQAKVALAAPNMNPKTNLSRRTSDSLLVATVDAKAVGGGKGVLYSCVNGGPLIQRSVGGQPQGHQSGSVRVNVNDPQVRKLVYNMYRGILNTKHERATDIVEAAPGDLVTTDQGVGERVVSMMRQQTDLREGKMMNLGPPPPPPPPPFATGTPPPARRPPAEIPTKPAPPIATPPAVLAGAMMKDRKPFTYTPGGINLAEIKSPRMQRRLQRNACMEGVRPSPLAQQPPPPSPGGISATLPPHGMIQVLPVPGMGMGPVVKPQPCKEPPKPKRKVCGPAPPPPPFAIGESSSVNASPSATPASASAITSVTPPTTPSTFSSPSSSLSSAPIENGTRNGWDSGHSGSDRSNLKPLMATEPGPSAPSPPPPPPPSSFASKKRFSYPSSSSTSSFVSKPETESSLSPITSPSTSKSPISSTHTKTKEQCDDHKTQEADSASLSEKIKSPSVASPDGQLPSLAQETKISLNDKTTAMLPPQDLTNHVNGESIPEVTPKAPKSVTTKMIKEQNEQHKNINETDNTITDKTDATVQNANESEKDKAIPILIHDDVKMKVKETVINANEEEINEKETTPQANEEAINKNETTPQANEEKVNDAVTETNEEKETVTEAKEEKVEEVKVLLTESKEEKVKEIKETVSEAEKEKVKEVREAVTETNEEKLKNETNLVEKDEVKGSDVNNVAETSPKIYSERTSPTDQSTSNLTSSKSRNEAKSSKQSLTSPVRTPNTPPIKDFSPKSATSKSTPTTVNHEKDPACTFRTAVRMASPPAALERETKALHHDRFIRQASLPAEPLSPSSGSKSVHKGSLYIPPVKPTSIDVNGTIKTPPLQNSNNSPTSSGLNKAPLPWMCGVKKEPSPPPEFLIHAQKTQERLQRQRSLTHKDSNRQQYSYDPQKNEVAINSCPVYQNNCSPTAPYSPPTSVATSSNPPRVLRNTDSAPQHTWRSPAYHSNSLNHQKKPYEQQQNHQQQNSFAKPHSQSFNHHQRVPAVSSLQATHSNSLPRERIIPIMLEESPPVTPTSKGPSFVVKSFVPPKVNQPFQTNYQRQDSWQNLPSPIGIGGAFCPYESQEKYHSSSNALEALQQMQQNLAQLNSGLQTAQNPAQPNGTLHTNNSLGQEPVSQSRSFRVLQNAFDHQDSTGTPVQLQQDTPAEMKKYTGSSIPSRSFRMLQAMTDNDEGPGPGESDL